MLERKGELSTPLLLFNLVFSYPRGIYYFCDCVFILDFIEPCVQVLQTL